MLLVWDAKVSERWLLLIESLASGDSPEENASISLSCSQRELVPALRTVRDAVVGDVVVGDAFLGGALVGDAVVGDALVGDTLVGDAVVGAAVVGEARGAGGHFTRNR